MPETIDESFSFMHIFCNLIIKHFLTGNPYVKMKLHARYVYILTPAVVVVLFSTWCCYNIYCLSEEEATIKDDFSLVNNISQGLLSVEKWRTNFINVAEHQIDDFELTPSQKDTLKREIEQLLNRIISQAADTLLHEKKETLKGKVEKALANMLIDEERFHNMVPAFSETILQKISSPGTKDKLKEIAREKLGELGKDTYDSSANKNDADSIIAKYNVRDKEAFNRAAEQRSDELLRKTYHFTFYVLAAIGIFVIAWLYVRKQPDVRNAFFIISIILALEILIVGLTSQMIELDARIKRLDFHLIGTSISFHNQVIFFRSKSIVDVVILLLKTEKFDSILVGILILLFSIVFPLSKLILGALYLVGGNRWHQNKIINFFAFKSGKWSMADVMVIAIFMAYIGFKGILDDQLKSINVSNETLQSISTNETSLQPGYILFIGFVIFSLFLSVVLNKITDTGK
ncbi:MAG TPA: paraquat-inducible protein A [Cyclobacteriaceae bacterium]|nr:paraquat-inducible protein A [Cyclobacteriaceae bacterium]